MELLSAIVGIGRRTYKFLKFCNECWSDTGRDDEDNNDNLNSSGTHDKKKRRTNIKKSSTVNSDVVEWVSTSIENAGDLIDTAVVGGYDINENDLWIIRARFRGQVIPGMLNQCKNKAVAPTKKDGSNVVKNLDTFEVLCIPPESRHRIIWTRCSNGDVPKNAVEAGRVSDEKLYVGREIQEEGHPGNSMTCPGMV